MCVSQEKDEVFGSGFVRRRCLGLFRSLTIRIGSDPAYIALVKRSLPQQCSSQKEVQLYGFTLMRDILQMSEPLYRQMMPLLLSFEQISLDSHKNAAANISTL
ncbi:unnamed protein product [Cylicocyclus nassatus]|uniref:Uncharacterized protein n=1 Tax=Cylicocyclus nassatus TaxID=53992 RepID=A0AA36M836_CYLNA|nr:unnamed protein product [Cylicocyclus nassatus]